MNLLQELLTKSQDVDLDTVKWPESKIKEDQTVVGTASDDAKRLWGLADLVAAQTKPLTEEHDEFCDGNCSALSKDDQKRHDALINKLLLIKLEHELIMEVFWTTVRREFPEIARKDQIGVGIEGQIYWKKSQRHPNIMGIEIITGPEGLAGLFGQD